jgi:SHS2 domain-containing protein
VSRGYRVLEHTADTGIEAWGPTPEAALEQAAVGLFAQLCEPGSVQERRSVTFSAHGPDDDTRAVHFLQEALAHWHLDRMVFVRFEVEPLSGEEVRARGFGEVYDPARHEILGELKAVTYHHAFFGKSSDGERWVVRVVIDI